MAQPSTGPADRAQVKADLGITDPRLDASIDAVVAAVNARVRRFRVAQIDADTWPDDVARGANMLAVRLFRRRDTPAGVAVFGDNAAVYVQRNDPDVALLLQLGAYAKPAVG